MASNLDAAKEGCTLDTCSASDSLYGYRPQIGVNAIAVVVYVLCLVQCIYVFVRWKKSWLSYTILVFISCLAQLIAYGLRVHGWFDPFVNIGWILQYTYATLAPIFVTAALYVTLGRLANIMGRGIFNLDPKLYPRIFLTSDAFSLVLQSAGGSLSFFEEVKDNSLTLGGKLAIIGLIFQVISLAVFLVLFVAVVHPARIFSPVSTISKYENQNRIRIFVCATLIGMVLIVARSAYRVVEFSEGPLGTLVHNEVLFIVFDTVPMAITAILLAFLHPNYMLPSDDASPSNVTSFLA
ncbi:RTA1 like protein-domain-containing protein [Nemania sp. FL0031]|nr:RTA1 like protein-domain-containing protein [Nemania sp. FL0031]